MQCKLSNKIIVTKILMLGTSGILNCYCDQRQPLFYSARRL